jgi:predicted molibdopterin-dependent oxidoreductase YjgC
LEEIASRLKAAPAESVALIGSARQTNEELWLLGRLKTRLGALSDAIPRPGQADKLLVCADRNPNSLGARRAGICGPDLGAVLPQIAAGIRQGKVKTLVVFGEDVTKHGIGLELLRQLELLVASEVLPNQTTEMAHFVLPGCAPAEKSGTFTNIKGRVQRFWKAVEPPGDARPEWEILRELAGQVTGQEFPATLEGLFHLMAREIPALAGLTWASLGDLGRATPWPAGPAET